MKADWAMICDYQARMTVRNRRGRVLETHWSRRHRGCTAGMAWFKWYPRRDMPRKGKLCTTFFEGGVQQGGSPCRKIKKYPWD